MAAAPKMRRRSPAGTFHVERSILRCVVGRFPALARDDVGGIPSRPVVLRSGRFIRAMVRSVSRRSSVIVATSMLLTPSGSRSLISWSNQPLPSGSLNDRKREVRAALRIRSGPRPCVPMKLRPVSKWNASLTWSRAGEFGTRCLDVVDDHHQSRSGARRRLREPLTEEEGARRAGGRDLQDPPVAADEIGVQPPPHAQVEPLGAIDIRDSTTTTSSFISIFNPPFVYGIRTCSGPFADTVKVAAFLLTNSCMLVGACPVRVNTSSDNRS